MARKADINLRVELDDKNMPSAITWQATDSGSPGAKNADAISVSIWDKNDKTTLSIDLWTLDMTIHDMNMFYYQKLVKMAETYEASTRFPDTSALIRGFADQFAKQVEEESKKMDEGATNG